jgi:GTP-binding protein LepA
MTELNRIRNFSIIAHIDHGKSTLADRLLEYTGTVAKREMKDRLLDTLELEQEKGITIKLQTARMKYNYEGSIAEKGEYILNLIDTPGHVDFSFEVSRSVAASEGALLLVDATQGVQAQTLSTMYKALEHDLVIIPVINKVDLPSAEVETTKLEIMEAFGFKEEEIILASGKTGIGVKEILDAIVERVPAPAKKDSNVTRGLVFDSFYHDFKGVVALIKLAEGEIKNRERLYFLGSGTEVTPVEIGHLKPNMIVMNSIKEGEVGYLATGLKDIRQVHVGDTITLWDSGRSHLKVEPLVGYQQPKPMVFASLYPVEASDFPDFQVALEKLALNDAALTYQKENSQALGTGFVCGFLGLLHLEVIQERLDREFNIDLISTSPTVDLK